MVIVKVMVLVFIGIYLLVGLRSIFWYRTYQGLRGDGWSLIPAVLLCAFDLTLWPINAIQRHRPAGQPALITFTSETAATRGSVCDALTLDGIRMLGEKIKRDGRATTSGLPRCGAPATVTIKGTFKNMPDQVENFCAACVERAKQHGGRPMA